MGRKKRKIDSTTEQGDELGVSEGNDLSEDVETVKDATPPTGGTAVLQGGKMQVDDDDETPSENAKKVTSSSYAITSHSGELIQEDVYVSDGSLDSDDEEEMEIVLTSSRMGIMRRGLHHQMMALQQPNRQWKRQDAAANSEDGPDNAASTSEAGEGVILTPEELEEIKRKREEEELSQLDPAQRAARLLIEKQRRELEAKIEERRRENEENVMRDPTLFSKRTAFDIRFDQIEDKPWERGVGSSDNHSEFFNYGLSEEDWLEYAAQQLIIRQELIDAYRQKRLPDPAVVPIQPSAKKEETATTSTDTATTTIQTPEEAEISNIAASNENVVQADSASNMETTETSNEISVAPAPAAPTEIVAPTKQEIPNIAIGIGGAWGAGAAPGSYLARLIEEQDMGGSTEVKSTTVKIETVDSQSEQQEPHDVNDTDSYRGKEFVKSEREHGRNKRRGSGGEADDASYNRDADDSSHYDKYDDQSSGRHWNRSVPPPPQGWLAPPVPGNSSQRMDAYNSYPPPPPHGSGYQGRGGRGGGRFPPRGGGRGGRGYYNRDAGSGRGDYYQEQQQSGWKRPRNDDDSRQRRY